MSEPLHALPDDRACYVEGYGVTTVGELRDSREVESGPVLVDTEPPTWRELLWTCAPETRLSVNDLMEAIDRGRSWIYARTSESSDDPIPHRKFGGCIWFVASEVRAWVLAHEEIVVPAPATGVRRAS